jgi:fibrillarin-like pre-rRNA processing protein
MTDFQEIYGLNIYLHDRKIYTINSEPGQQVYGENLIKYNDVEYRNWDPFRSKLAALILKGCKRLPIEIDTKLLYLGAGSGTTISHLSDIITQGKIFAIEFSPRSFRDLLSITEKRKNIIPILENAYYPKRYSSIISDVDVIYQDISQRDQVNIFNNNAIEFLKPGNSGIFMVKSRSIDITLNPKEVYRYVLKELRTYGYKIVEQIELDPYSKDHLGIMVEI